MKALLEKYKLIPISAHIGAAAVEENLPYIDALGIKYVFIPWVGTETFSSPEKYAELLQTVKKAKALLDERGVVFGYHNHAHEYEGGNDYIGKITKECGIKAELDVFGRSVAGKDAGAERSGSKGTLSFVLLKRLPKKIPQRTLSPS